TFEGVDLKVGGEGMRAFYDKILPSAVNKWAKKLGGRVGTARVGAPVRFEEYVGPNYILAQIGEALTQADAGGPDILTSPLHGGELRFAFNRTDNARVVRRVYSTMARGASFSQAMEQLSREGEISQSHAEDIFGGRMV